MKNYASYELSVPAEKDLDELFDYTHNRHSFSTAVDYLNALENVLLDIVAFPEMGKTRDEIKPELRSLAFKEHVIFYRILPRRKIRVVRVLHASRDIPNFF